MGPQKMHSTLWVLVIVLGTVFMVAAPLFTQQANTDDTEEISDEEVFLYISEETGVSVENVRTIIIGINNDEIMDNIDESMDWIESCEYIAAQIDVPVDDVSAVLTLLLEEGSEESYENDVDEAVENTLGSLDEFSVVYFSDTGMYNMLGEESGAPLLTIWMIMFAFDIDYEAIDEYVKASDNENIVEVLAEFLHENYELDPQETTPVLELIEENHKEWEEKIGDINLE